jgi:DHA3 family macrolide efflux protein-like MFS transporter
MMILSESGAGLDTLALALLLIAGQQDVWHISLATTVSSVFHSFQCPAYLAATTLLVPKRHLSRASGMREGATAAARILAPLLGAVLITTIHLHRVILTDFATFLFALVTLAVVWIPKPERTTEGTAGEGLLLREAAYGWMYIMARPGVRELLCFVTINDLMIAMPIILMTPLVLSPASATMLGRSCPAGVWVISLVVW